MMVKRERERLGCCYDGEHVTRLIIQHIILQNWELPFSPKHKTDRQQTDKETNRDIPTDTPTDRQTDRQGE